MQNGGAKLVHDRQTPGKAKTGKPRAPKPQVCLLFVQKCKQQNKAVPLKRAGS